MENARVSTDYRITVSAEADRWRWSVARDRVMAAGHAPTAPMAGGSARVAAAVISGLGRIAQRRF
jgi:hypothetical protein